MRHHSLSKILLCVFVFLSFSISSSFLFKLYQLQLIDKDLPSFYPLSYWIADVFTGLLTQLIWVFILAFLIQIFTGIPGKRSLALLAALSPLEWLAFLSEIPSITQTQVTLKLLSVMATCYIYRHYMDRNILGRSLKTLGGSFILAAGVTIFYFPLVDPANMQPPDILEMSYNFPSALRFIIQPLLYLQDPAWNPSVALGGYSMVAHLTSHIYYMLDAAIALFKPALSDLGALIAIFRFSLFSQIILCAVGYFILFYRVFKMPKALSLCLGFMAVITAGFIDRTDNEIWWGLVCFVYPWLFLLARAALQSPSFAAILGAGGGLLFNLHFNNPEVVVIGYYFLALFFLVHVAISKKVREQWNVVKVACIFAFCALLMNYRLNFTILDYMIFHPNKVVDQKEFYPVRPFYQVFHDFYAPFIYGTPRNFFFGFIASFFSVIGFFLGWRKKFIFLPNNRAFYIFALIAPALTCLLIAAPVGQAIKSWNLPALPGHHPWRHGTICHFTFLTLLALGVSFFLSLPQLLKKELRKTLILWTVLALSFGRLIYGLNPNHRIGVGTYAVAIIPLLLIMPYKPRYWATILCLLITCLHFFPNDRKPFLISLSYFKEIANKGTFRPQPMEGYSTGMPQLIEKRIGLVDARYSAFFAAEDPENMHNKRFLDARAQATPQQLIDLDLLFEFPNRFITNLIPPTTSRIGNFKSLPVVSWLLNPSLFPTSVFFPNSASSARWYAELDYYFSFPINSLVYDWDYFPQLGQTLVNLLNFQFLMSPKENFEEPLKNLHIQMSSLEALPTDNNLNVQAWLNREAFPKAFLYRTFKFYPDIKITPQNLFDPQRVTLGKDLLKSVDILNTLLLPSDIADAIHPMTEPRPSDKDIVVSSKIIGNFAFFKLKEPHSDGILFYSDMFHRDWRAFSGATSRPVYKANLSFKGIPIEKEDRLIWLEFRSRSQYICKLLMQLILLSSLLVALYGKAHAFC